MDKAEGVGGGVLVIGADSLIGAALLNELRSRNIFAVGTSRRQHCANIFLDLARPIDLSALPEARTVFICAGINGFAACNGHPATAALVNISATLVIGTHYMEHGGHVIFLSSTAVFGARSDTPDEQDVPSPNTTYCAFKCATEIALLEAARNSGGAYSVVRLTKVLSTTSSLLNKWRLLGVKGQIINAFMDVFIAPISPNYVVNGLLEIADRRVAGCFHLAGEKILSYAELAYALSERQLIPANLINMTNQSATTQITSSFQCNALAMPRTLKILSIRPQPLANFLGSIELLTPESRFC